MTLRFSNGNYWVEDTKILNILSSLSAPLFIISEKSIRKNIQIINESFENEGINAIIYYSCKANSNISILSICRQEGTFAETVSTGEVFLCLRAGFEFEKILFTSPLLTNSEIEFLHENDITININSLGQLKRIKDLNYAGSIFIRINPKIRVGFHSHCQTAKRSSKFGIPLHHVDDVISFALLNGFNIKGFHFHLGSNINSIDPYLNAVLKTINVINEVEEKFKLHIDTINIGGGFSIPYKKEEKAFNFIDLSKKLAPIIKKKKIKIALEPGRFCVGNSSILLTKVNDVRKIYNRNIIYIDAGFNLLLRPVLYNSYHEIINITRYHKESMIHYDIVGPLCEEGDVLGYNRELPITQVGDILAILNVGAYGFAMSSSYNSRLRCGEILVNENQFDVIRNPESIEDLIKDQIIPDRLST